MLPYWHGGRFAVSYDIRLTSLVSNLSCSGLLCHTVDRCDEMRELKQEEDESFVWKRFIQQAKSEMFAHNSSTSGNK